MPVNSAGRMSPAVVMENLSVNRGGAEILKNLTARIAPGKITAIIGPNGAGKTTLLLAILGLIPFSGRLGFVDVDNQPVQPKMAYVPQSLSFDRQSLVTVIEFMALDLQTRPIWFGIKASVRNLCLEALKGLEVKHLAEKALGKLSGGEMQRVLLAKALQRDPDILLLDEPVSGVDIAGGHLFCDVLEKIRTEHRMTLIMVSHDLSVVSQHAERVLCINQALSCEGETPLILNSDNLMRMYGIHAGLHEHHHVDQKTTCDHHHDDPSHPHSHAH